MEGMNRHRRLRVQLLTGAGQIGFFTTAPTPFILLNTVANPGPGAIDFEDATIRVTGVHNVDASFFVL